MGLVIAAEVVGANKPAETAFFVREVQEALPFGQTFFQLALAGFRNGRADVGNLGVGPVHGQRRARGSASERIKPRVRHEIETLRAGVEVIVEITEGHQIFKAREVGPVERSGRIELGQQFRR